MLIVVCVNVTLTIALETWDKKSQESFGRYLWTLPSLSNDSQLFQLTQRREDGVTEGHDDEKCARFQFLHRLFFRQTEQSRELRKERVRGRGKGGSKILPFERPTADAPFSSSDAESCSSYFRSCPFPPPTRRSSPRASRPSRLLAKSKLDASVH